MTAAVHKVMDGHADGINIDIETYLGSKPDPALPAALTKLARKAADAMHSAVPGSHVTFDVYVLGINLGRGLFLDANVGVATAVCFARCVSMEYPRIKPGVCTGMQVQLLYLRSGVAQPTFQ